MKDLIAVALFLLLMGVVFKLYRIETMVRGIEHVVTQIKLEVSH